MPEGCRGCCMTIIMIPLMICALVACMVIFITTNRPEEPLGASFRPSASEASAFNNEIVRATNSAASQSWFYVQFTERQLSSWLALEGATYAEQHDFIFPFDDLQVGMDAGQFTFWSTINRSGIAVPLVVVIEPRVDGNGHLDFKIDSAELAGVPLPAFVLDSVTNQLESKVIDTIDALPGDYVLYPESMSVADGSFVVHGTVQR